MLWLLACVDEPSPPGIAPAADPARNLVIIVIDTLREDALEVAHTPRIDGVSTTRAKKAWSAGTWTVPSVISLFTGKLVRAHGWDLPTGQMGRYPPIPADPTLAEVLKEQGFRTDGLYANPYLAEKLGFDRGFDTWRRAPDKAMPKVFAEVVAQHWGDPGRHFAYLHLLGPHSPLHPSPEAAARAGLDPAWLDPKLGLEGGRAQRNREPGVREAYAQAYRAVIEDTDLIVGQLLDALGPALGETLVVITSDHGELLGEHGWVGHGHWVWEPLAAVPLRLNRAVTLPEALSTAALPALACAQLALVCPFQADHPMVVQREGKLGLLLEGHIKGVWQEGEGQAFDLALDPGEERPLELDPRLIQARADFEASTPAGRVGGAAELDGATREELKALGYQE